MLANVLVQLADSAWEALRHIRQAADFLVCVSFLNHKKTLVALIQTELSVTDLFSWSSYSSGHFPQTKEDMEGDTQ